MLEPPALTESPTPWPDLHQPSLVLSLSSRIHPGDHLGACPGQPACQSKGAGEAMCPPLHHCSGPDLAGDTGLSGHAPSPAHPTRRGVHLWPPKWLHVLPFVDGAQSPWLLLLTHKPASAFSAEPSGKCMGCVPHLGGHSVSPRAPPPHQGHEARCPLNTIPNTALLPPVWGPAQTSHCPQASMSCHSQRGAAQVVGLQHKHQGGLT